MATAGTRCSGLVNILEREGSSEPDMHRAFFCIRESVCFAMNEAAVMRSADPGGAGLPANRDGDAFERTVAVRS